MQKYKNTAITEILETTFMYEHETMELQKNNKISFMMSDFAKLQ